MNEIVDVTISEPQPHSQQRAVSMLDLPPKQMVDQVSSMANILSDIIEKQKMFQKFGDKKYVTVDGWCTLGSMLGILPAERDVHEISEGYYAKVDLVNKNSGIVVGSASAICTRSEKSWRDRPDYAVRSMAITRATGKAYRLAFSWIMNMAGYMSTPAEEMPDENPVFNKTESETKSNAPRSNNNDKKTPNKIIFDAKNQAFLDKLDKVLVERNIPPDKHILIANDLNGKEFTKESLEKSIDDFKDFEIPF